ncbi:MAG TPA: hypothetical protein VG758_17150 [Hyphomicrobiaceae bacterium]|jgi:hypothetical protein|nr:hypothetical protein [Hyphomicrobiaceae bacterium]
MTEGGASEQDDNWLDGHAIACPSCQLPLWQVVHSPFYDNWFFYCDRCSRRADVSFYDAEVKAIYDAFVAGGDSRFQSERMYREIERRLAPCDCGGQFRKSADRRCHGCHAVVLAGANADDIDLWPHWPGAQLDELTPQQEREMQEFEKNFVRSESLWQHPN